MRRALANEVVDAYRGQGAAIEARRYAQDGTS